MPNRGPIVLSIDEVEAVLDCLPPPRSPASGADVEERQQLAALEAARERLCELKRALCENAISD